jgi:hypothetical protein
MSFLSLAAEHSEIQPVEIVFLCQPRGLIWEPPLQGGAAAPISWHGLGFPSWCKVF